MIHVIILAFITLITKTYFLESFNQKTTLLYILITKAYDEYKIVPSQKENNKINVRGWLLNDARKYMRKYILLIL